MDADSTFNPGSLADMDLNMGNLSYPGDLDTYVDPLLPESNLSSVGFGNYSLSDDTFMMQDDIDKLMQELEMIKLGILNLNITTDKFVIVGIMLTAVSVFGLAGNIVAIVVLSQPEMKGSFSSLLIGKYGFRLSTQQAAAASPNYFCSL